MKKKIILFLSFAGLLFAGYMSGLKFFSDTCAFGEGCPYFLGYPACYYGFFMYLIITIFAYLVLFNKINQKTGLKSLITVSFLGVLFAGYFTLLEFPLLFQEGLSAYVLGLPTCALGLIFYILILIFSVKEYKMINN